MKLALKLLGWLLSGIGVLILGLLAFHYTTWPLDAIGILILGTGVLLVIRFTTFPDRWRGSAPTSAEPGRPWWWAALAFVAGLSVVAVPNAPTIAGAFWFAAQDTTDRQDQRLLTDPDGLRAGLAAIREAAGTEQISELSVDQHGMQALVPDTADTARTFQYRRPGTLGGGGTRVLEETVPPRRIDPSQAAFTDGAWERIPEFLERAADNADAAGGRQVSPENGATLRVFPDRRGTGVLYHLSFREPVATTTFDA